MSSKQLNSDDYKYYVEKLLFNHEIQILSQFLKDFSFEKKEEYALFTEEDFKGKTDFSLNIEVESENRDNNSALVSLSVNLEASKFTLKETNAELLSRFSLSTSILSEKSVFPLKSSSVKRAYSSFFSKEKSFKN